MGLPAEVYPTVEDVVDGELTGTMSRAKILRFEAELGRMPQEYHGLQHFFAPGMYARQMTLRAGSCCVGKIHKFAHLSVISMGDVTVVTEKGRERMRAPHTFVSEPGAKRVIFAHADTVWTTFHATEETDPDRVEEEVIAKTYDELDHLLIEAVPCRS